MSRADHLGPYELRGELGRGAMARVWRAWDPGLRREVAIKEPLLDASLSQATYDELARRFVTEGRAAARLTHPNIVGVYAIDVWDGRPGIVMELVRGVTLAQILQQGMLTVDEALSILDQLLDAVGYAHAHGVVHRDIKPDNVFVTTEGVVKLADFGVAHIEDVAATRLTMAGTVIGTPGYLSPEQAVGKPVDARSDLFSIGVVAYEMLTGSHPFGAGSPDATTLIYRIVHEPVPELPLSEAAGIPAPMGAAILKALEKDPADRPASAAELKALLHGGELPEAPTMRRTPPVGESGAGDMPGSGAAVTLRDAGSQTTAPPLPVRRLPNWLPYVVVGVVCCLALVVALLSATSGGGGGAAPVPAASESSPASDADEADATSDEQAGTYTVTIRDGCLVILDAAGEVEVPSTVDASLLPTKVVAELERGYTHDSLDEATKDLELLADDAWPLASWDEEAAKLPEPSPTNRVMPNTDERYVALSRREPFWGIVIIDAATSDEAWTQAEAIAEQYGKPCEVHRVLDWKGFLGSDPRTFQETGERYLVMTGCSDTYQEVLEEYLSLAEVIGLGKLDGDAITRDPNNERLLEELGDDIRYSGTRRTPSS